uniref:Cytochrome c domain-containing protein n=2 Tax=Cupriavidus TaxID=106589 RepID=Q470S1_CUPPJ
MNLHSKSILWSAVFCIAVIMSGCSKLKSGHVEDEAQQAGRKDDSFQHAAEDYFRDMDRGVALTKQEVQGRNMWIVWTGGNDRFWDAMTHYTFGAFDLLKSISSHPSQGYSRDNRWTYLGLINEPCFSKPTGADPQRFGLWLDQRGKDCPADPFENEQAYPGVKIGARGGTFSNGQKLPVGSYYGYPTGIVGLRLFPNPAFDEKAAKAWDPERYYTDPSYYNRADLIRPYRVGMSCGFCHIGPSPVHPPADPEHPQWAELSSTVGAQYMWVDRLFIHNAATPAGKQNFMFQLVHTFRPGAMDTSLVSTDNINNPRTMNALYDLMARMGVAKRIGHETIAGGEKNNKQLNDFVQSGPLSEFFKAPDTVWTPHVLKDGADSVGVLGALNRVYLNIGLFSEEWLLHFNPILGGKSISPIEIAVAQKNSAYWRATEAGSFNMAAFLLKSTPADHLADAPGGKAFLADPATPDGGRLLNRGKAVFAETCARCHSSKGPPPPADLKMRECGGDKYIGCFQRYWKWTQTDEYKAKMRDIVNAPDFLANNYLSSDVRVPATLLRTNICSPLATNALRGNIWDNFSSETYKSLPSVGTVTLHDPFTAERWQYHMPAGGRGYTRVPSLISIWSTAPFLLNNALGPFSGDPSVKGRVQVFDASIEQLLWPEKRDHDSVLGTKVPGVIDRTTERSQITIPVGFVPDALRPMEDLLHRWVPWLVGEGGDVTIGPAPARMPVNLLANLQPLSETSDPVAKAEHAAKVLKLLVKLKGDLASVPAGASDDDLRKIYADVVKPMLSLSKCPDFVVNRGHYFGTAEFNNQDGLSADERAFGKEPVLSDDDKRALIAFLKTF